MLKTVALIIGSIVVGVLAFASFQPDTVQIQRSLTMPAPPDKMFSLMNAYHLGRSWVSSEHKDSAMQRTFSGADRGEGVVYAFATNQE
ncbi:MAG: hypothetical protein U0236_09770 [Nitrospira sp.]